MSLVLPPGGTLIGLGCDIIEVERIRGVLAKHGDRFLKRIFTDEEQAYCNSLKYPHKHYAARWAAKEAVSKCFTTGIGEHLDWTSVSVYHGTRKEPLVRLDAANVPDWMVIWEHDFDMLREMAYDYVQKMVTRYRKQVAVWNVAAGVQTNTRSQGPSGKSSTCATVCTPSTGVPSRFVAPTLPA